MANLAKIVFFGSGPVAAESLRLLAQDFEIEAVITKSSTLQEMEKSLNEYEGKNTNFYAANNRLELDEIFSKQGFESEIAVLIDFGIIVSQRVIDAFPFGIVNSHFSLLPEWRGADPISFAILSGQKQTGVSLMMLAKGMDTGDLLGQSDQEISDTDTTLSLTEKLIKRSFVMLKTLVPEYLKGKIDRGKQIEVSVQLADFPSYSRKLTKADGLIDWNKPASLIEREIRAYQPWPKSRTKFKDIEVILIKAHAVPVNDLDKKPGDYEFMAKEGLFMVETPNGYLCIDELQPLGKRPMSIKAFLAGYKNKI